MVILSNAGARVDLEIRRGAAFAQTLVYKTNGVVTNISGYTFAAQVRTTAGALAATFTCTIIDAVNGVFSFSLTSAQTASLVAGMTYEWDLEVTISGTTSELFRGDVLCINEVTQP